MFSLVLLRQGQVAQDGLELTLPPTPFWALPPFSIPHPGVVRYHRRQVTYCFAVFSPHCLLISNREGPLPPEWASPGRFSEGRLKLGGWQDTTKKCRSQRTLCLSKGKATTLAPALDPAVLNPSCPIPRPSYRPDVQVRHPTVCSGGTTPEALHARTQEPEIRNT